MNLKRLLHLREARQPAMLLGFIIHGGRSSLLSCDLIGLESVYGEGLLRFPVRSDLVFLWHYNIMARRPFPFAFWGNFLMRFCVLLTH